MINNLDIKKPFKILVPLDFSKKEKGDFFENLMAPVFQCQRWEVIKNIAFEGMQVDLYLKNLDTPEKGLVECKFQENLIDAPIVEKILGQVLIKGCQYAFLVSTSELNSSAKAVVEEYKSQSQTIKLIVWSGEKLTEIFMSTYNIKAPDIDDIEVGQVNTITLLVTHKKDFVWVAEEIGEDSEPCRAIIIPISNNTVSQEEWITYFSRHGVWQGLDIVVVSKENGDVQNKFTLSSKIDIEKITLSRINQADSFDDYHRPCRPEDFVGRSQAQNKFWDFIKNVKDNKTDLRLVCFTGSTGVGKSSLIIKLKHDCYQHYKDNFYIYDIDVTSVNTEKSNFFVVSAIKKALQQAVNDNFISLANHKIIIDSTEQAFFKSRSIQILIDKLKEENKVLVIFFDQFEEILTKDSLSNIYDLFKRTAFDIDALKENIVLGFCWRTDITLPAENKAYHAWHELERIRKNIDLNEYPFSEQDSKALISRFDEYLVQQGRHSILQKKMRNWIIDNCQSIPWLLKKICGDIYNQHLNQDDFNDKKIITKFDIQQIFDRDINRYIKTPEQDDCLKFIAANSPISRIEVCNKFNYEIINNLLSSKLVVETGNNYKIYWDIFREYLVDKKLPVITINYKPRTRISTLIKVFRMLKHESTTKGLSEKLQLKKSTINNAIDDLQNFFQVTLDRKRDIIIVPVDIRDLTDNELAENLAEQIESHLLIKEISNKIKPDQWLWYEEFKQLMSKLSSKENLKPETQKDYASRMLSWFCFAGLLEIRQNWLIARPIHPRQGKQKGKPLECEFNKKRMSKSSVNPDQLNLFDYLM
ncbi:MAG: restriction endonuclease [Nostoc sp. TH1S01]|nr:restriction endonuclease [Nostoc sp. TH1S01]